MKRCSWWDQEQHHKMFCMLSIEGENHVEQRVRVHIKFGI